VPQPLSPSELMIVLEVVRLPSHGEPPLELPSYATAGSAGMDLRIAATITIAPRAYARAPTGLAFAIPDGFEGQVRPRSGLAAKHGLTVLNAPGTIDSDYRGEVQVLLVNHGEAPVTLERGERIAQLVIAPVVRVVPTLVKILDETARGAGGFGHSGTR